MFLPHPRVNVSIVGSLCDREVAYSASDRQGSNFESCVWRTVSSQSSHHPQEIILAQFSLYVHKGGLKPDSFHFITISGLYLTPLQVSTTLNQCRLNDGPPSPAVVSVSTEHTLTPIQRRLIVGPALPTRASIHSTAGCVSCWLGVQCAMYTPAECWPTVCNAGTSTKQHCITMHVHQEEDICGLTRKALNYFYINHREKVSFNLKSS